MEVKTKRMPSFGEWIKTKTSGTAFTVLDTKDKWKYFLQYKHGFTTHATNEIAEQEMKQEIERLEQMPEEMRADLKPDVRGYYQKKIDWNTHCWKEWDGIKSNNWLAGLRGGMR